MKQSMFYFCTYFDSHYLIKGLALYRSLSRHAKPFRLWVLCFDDLTYKILQKLSLPDVVPISLEDFERRDEELVQVKGNRSQIEYYFTCTPSLPIYILRNYPEVDVITYLDADLFFFSEPSPIYQELGDNSVLIIGHRFPPRLSHLEKYGIYNVGLLSFRRDKSAFECLHWWRERCLEWCYDRIENGRFADQKYLDDWPSRFSGVRVLQHKGVGLAPWNISNYTLYLNAGHVMVDGQPLILFHFHNLKQRGKWIYDPGLITYQSKLTRLVKHYIYIPYIMELRNTARQISLLANISMQAYSIRYPQPQRVVPRLIRKVRDLIHLAKLFLKGDLIICF